MKKAKSKSSAISTEKAVVIKNVSKKYNTGAMGGFYAVNNVSLEIEKGEFVSIVGTSGSGKSTLMHMIGGVEKPTEGKIYLCGRDLYAMDDDELSEFRSGEIGIVYQFFNLIPVLNIEENVAFPVIAAGKKPDFFEIERLLSRLGLKHMESFLPNQLSGGQQQRVAIARSIIMKPSVILADEPTGSLDSRNSAEVISLLESVCRENDKALIVITHDEKIAARADRIIRIEDGRIVSDTKREKAVI